MREPLLCLRCGEKLKSLGQRELCYGPPHPFLSAELDELLRHRMDLHALTCRKCGHTEFFDSKLLAWTEEDEDPIEIPVPDELQDLPLLPGGESFPPEEPS